MTPSIQCHYDVLGIARDADNATIKKHHRKMALKWHPDKNFGNDEAAEQFRVVQQAYECLSDPRERKWYDEHREAILAGWTAASDDDIDMTFNMILFMHPSCFSGYHDAKGGFYYVYKNVFRDIASCERNQGDMLVELPTKFGNADSDWLDVLNFYQHWESFVSALNFAWEDIYNVFEDAANRKIKRLMEEENKKARKNAKKTYNQDVLALVAFVKRRDPRVKAKQQELEKQKMEKQQKVKMEAEERKKEQQLAKEAWKEEAARAMMQAEEEDRLHGRVRLADLEDDYDYGGGKKKKGRGKKKKNKQRHEEEQYQEEMKVLEKISLLMGDEEDKEKSCETLDDEEGEADAAGEDQTEPSAMRDETGDDLEVEEPPVPIEAEEEYFSESSSEEEPDIWQCECCRKIFKSEGQMENHMKSKKHKLAFKKYQEKLMRQEEEEVMEEMMHSLVMEP